MGENIKIEQLKGFHEAELRTDIRDMITCAAANYEDTTAFRIKVKKGSAKSEPIYRDVSYRTLREEIDALGTGLIELGLGGKHIAMIGENSYPWFLSYLTVLCGVGTLIPLDKGLPYTELRNSIDRSYAEVLIFDKKHSSLADQLIAEGSGVKYFICMDDTDQHPCLKNILSSGKELLAAGNDKYTRAVINPTATALLIFTSGTTSNPKAVMLSHRNLVFNLYTMHMAEDILYGDVNIALLPYHHTFGATGQLLMLDCGVTTVFCDGLKYIQKNLVEYQVSLFIGVPLIMESIYKRLMNGIVKQGKEKAFKKALKLSKVLRKIGIDKRRSLFKDIHNQLGGSLRLVVTGASALDPAVSIGFSDIGIEVIQGYGMTETSPVIAAENKLNICPGKIGKAFPGILVEIENPNEEGVGEIITKSPSVMLGYYEQPEETAKVIVDGWMHTGDLARVDKNGNLELCGRSKNVIVLKNGKNVYPEEIEAVIDNLPYVKENIVYAEAKKGDSDDRDKVIVVKIVYDADYFKLCYNLEDPDSILAVVEKDIDKINSEMPTYKHIHRVTIQETEMIKTTTGKVKRFKEGATR